RPLCWRAAHRGRGTGVVAPSPGPDRRRTSVPPDGAGGPGGAGRRPRDVVVPTRLDRHGPSIARSHPDQLFATRPAGELRIAVRALGGAWTGQTHGLPRVGGEPGTRPHRPVREGGDPPNARGARLASGRAM